MNKHLVDKAVLDYALEVLEDVQAEINQEEVAEYFTTALDRKIEKARKMLQQAIGGS